MIAIGTVIDLVIVTATVRNLTVENAEDHERDVADHVIVPEDTEVGHVIAIDAENHGK